MIRIIWLLISVGLISGCSETLQRIKRIGHAPEFSTVKLPSNEEDPEDYVNQHMIEQHKKHIRETNSLWQPGSTTFFRDSRAWRVGDILTVVVEIKDSATLDNTTKQKRGSSDSLGVPKLFGKENDIAHTFSKTGDPTSLIKANSKQDHAGEGSVSRKENVKIEIAALVTRVLSNGNLMIRGQQEIRINHELREVKVFGIIRPKDITSNNSINSNQIAEARVSYGGKGGISDMQQPRVGYQVIDAISPF